MIPQNALSSWLSSDLLLEKIVDPVGQRLLEYQPNSQSNKWKEYIDKPVAFVHDFFTFPPGEGPAVYQEEALDKLITERRVSLRGPHGLGKTTLAAWCIIWFACTRPIDTKIPTTASAWRQLEKFLWPEIRKWYRLCNWQKWADLGGMTPEMFTLKMKVGEGCEAFALASDQAELIEGAHADNLLYIFDESKAIPPDTWDAAEGAFASGDAYWLAISTPGERGGRFFDIHRKAPGLEDWWTRHVKLADAIEAGRINAEWAEARRRQWGEDSPVYQARVLGEFPEQEADALISLVWVTDARERDLKPLGTPNVGVDIARFGTDDSAMFGRQGDVVMSAEVWHGNDTMQSAGRIKSKGWDANIDDIGVGSGVVDRLAEQKFTVKGINVGESAVDKDHFKNLRAELYWNLRLRLKEGEIDLSRIPQKMYDRLSGELTSIKYKYTSKGQIQIESKKEMKKRLKRSPDLADALMLAFAPSYKTELPDEQPEQPSKFMTDPVKDGKSRWKV